METVLPIGRARRPGLAFRRDALAPDEIVQVHGGVRVTSAARTVFDLGRVTPIVHAILGVDALRNAGEVTLDDIRAVASRHLGVQGGGQLPQVLRRSTHLADSPMESRIRVAIEDAGLPLPVLQHKVGPYVDGHVRIAVGQGAENSVQYSTSWPTPTATNRHAGFSGQALHQNPYPVGTFPSASVAVRRRDESAGVDLDRGQTVAAQHVEGIVKRTVVQAGGLGAELEGHGRSDSFGEATVTAARSACADRTTAAHDRRRGAVRTTGRRP